LTVSAGPSPAATLSAPKLAARRPALEGRAAVLKAVRNYFDSQGFLEVETPSRVTNPGQEFHLDAFYAQGGRYLITSPEHHMKRLVGAGYDRVYQICRCFRSEEQGPHHQPEFTMAEWYRTGAPLETIADDCEALLRVASIAAGNVAPINAVRTTVAALMQRHAGVELEGDETAAELASKLRAAGHDPRGAETWDDLFFQVFLDHVEPALKAGAPTFVFDWPAPLAALARKKPGNNAWAERFELYARGLELANAFGELTDPVEQRFRFETEARLRGQRDKVVYPVDEKLLAALATMPPTSGVAMGMDRLVMWALGTDDIRDIVAFPDDEV
jgi:elongation factor P--(R)-beta-lysine ligase